jgi:hypothetical protein
MQLCINLRKGRGVTDVRELLGFRNKSILAGDMNAKHPGWNSKVSNPSGMKLLEIFVSSNFEMKFHLHSDLCITHMMVEVMFSTL